jgi:Asp-tRNA(Asn)/Glu-tRNA(Gln) amidotransferase C subunit
VLDEASKRQIKHLCNLIANESDRDRFSQLIKELNQVFESAEPRFESDDNREPSPANAKSP